MKRIVVTDKSKNLFILFETVLILFLFVSKIPKTKNVNSEAITTPSEKISQEATSDELEYPPLNLPVEYFEPSETSIGAGVYSVIRGEQAYRSYPSTHISLNNTLYSITPTVLPPIKSDKEIHTSDPEMDFIGESKQESIRKYGDLGRRFVGAAGEAWDINNVEYVDLDADGKKETILSLFLLGANIIGQKNIVIKGDQIIFSTDQKTFSNIVPAKNGNGFFLEWDDNFKQRDGYVVTRFISENNTFRPVYEQKIRYIRVKTSTN